LIAYLDPLVDRSAAIGLVASEASRLVLEALRTTVDKHT
jgi:hypothetical protein